MRQAVTVLTVDTPGRGLLEVSTTVREWLASEAIQTGLMTLFCRHTSASLLIQENAASEVRDDLEAYFQTIAPEDPHRYRHDEEGPDDMPAHIRTALTGIHLCIPVIGGRLALGRWQGIYLFEHRRRPQVREIAVHLLGQSHRPPPTVGPDA